MVMDPDLLVSHHSDVIPTDTAHCDTEAVPTQYSTDTFGVATKRERLVVSSTCDQNTCLCVYVPKGILFMNVHCAQMCTTTHCTQLHRLHDIKTSSCGCQVHGRRTHLFTTLQPMSPIHAMVFPDVHWEHICPC